MFYIIKAPNNEVQQIFYFSKAYKIKKSKN